MIFSHFIDEIDEVTAMTDERICTFCDRDAVCLICFGSLKVHLCEAHSEPR